MAGTVLINGTALNPQPRDISWQSSIIKGKLDATDALGAAYIVTLTSPNSRGGTASWNWSTFENTVLTSVVIPARGVTLRDSTYTTYNSGVTSKQIRTVASVPGDVLPPISLEIVVVV
jgi:hypothetical protein